jgi:hypothetical protein
MNVSNTCVVCRLAVVPTPLRPSYHHVDCPRCGAYEVHSSIATFDDEDLSRFPEFLPLRHLVSAWIRRQTNTRARLRERDSAPRPRIDFDTLADGSEWLGEVRRAGFPVTFPEKLDALLLLCAARVEPYFRREIPSLEEARTVAEVAARDPEDLSALWTTLGDLGLVDIVERDLTARGIERVEALRQTGTISSAAFIAMWFDESTRAFHRAASEAIESGGYRPVRIDDQHFSGFIMDQVVDAIRGSRFVVADFTSGPETRSGSRVLGGSRGGVYWEAGFAYALGRPVLHTCRDDAESKSRLHFDVAQYPTVFWRATDSGELVDTASGVPLAERLRARILALNGAGPGATK